jgi:hypothetical protein
MKTVTYHSKPIDMKNYILLFLFTLNCFAQDKRSELKVDLVFDLENNYSVTIPESPYFVKENVLQIYPGEELNIETEIKGNSIVSMKVVKTVDHPERTINIRFFQDAKDRNKTQMMLVVKNPFNKKLLYDALIYIPAHQEWSRTSIIPIQPNLVNYEMWPDVIATMALENWRFVD